jgi:hypothetical protein
MKYYKHPETGEVFAYENEQERQEWGAPELVEMTPEEIDAYLNPSPTAEQIMSRLEARVQFWLDEQARALGYDDIKSAVTYAEEPAVPKYQQEGQAMRRLRSLAWERWYEILNAVQAGQRSIPTEDELIAEMEALK